MFSHILLPQMCSEDWHRISPHLMKWIILIPNSTNTKSWSWKTVNHRHATRDMSVVRKCTLLDYFIILMIIQDDSFTNWLIDWTVFDYMCWDQPLKKSARSHCSIANGRSGSLTSNWNAFSQFQCLYSRPTIFATFVWHSLIWQRRTLNYN